MSTFKCTFCGGSVKIDEEAAIATCEYCGNKFPVESGKSETIHRFVDEAKIKEIESLQHKEETERLYAEKKRASALKVKMILLAIWGIAVAVLWILSACTVDNVGFSPYQLLLIPTIIFGIVIIIIEIKKFFNNS